MTQQKALDKALRISRHVNTYTAEDAARDLARTLAHREQYIAELRSAALSGETIDDIHPDCPECDAARTIVATLRAALTTAPK